MKPTYTEAYNKWAYLIKLTPVQTSSVTMDADIRTKGLKKPVDVAQYLFTRLYQIGVRSVHGVPGDYNLVALDYLPKTNLKWVGSVNELNAGTYLSSPV